MATQINVRLPENLLTAAVSYAEKHGFQNIQELIKESLREKTFEQPISKKELILVKKLTEISNKKNLFGTEEELFKKLRRR